MKKISNKEFVQKIEKKFPNRFTFEKTIYTGQRNKVTLTCKEHGDFTRSAQLLFRKGTQGCPECKKIYGFKSMRSPITKVLAQFKTAHGDKYDYSKVNYHSTKTKVEIICKKHGSFWQTPYSHSKGFGCDACGGTAKLTNDEFIQRANNKHNNKYVYLSPYVSYEKKITILCPTHGIFKQTPHGHLSGQGCFECGKKLRTGVDALPQELIIERFLEVHGNRYDYSKVKYKNRTTDVTIICRLHGEFEQRPSNHLIGHGCNSCTEYGFIPTKPAVLYYLKIEGGIAYKIGVTNHDVQTRFINKDLEKIEIIKTWVFDVGMDAYKKEQEILKQFKYAKYKGDDLLTSGNTELFNRDVLLLDN